MKKNGFFKTVLFLGMAFFEFLGFGLAGLVPQAQAGQYDCSASVTFDANPKTITDSQSATISGSVILVTPGGVICQIPNTGGKQMQQLRVAVFNKQTSQVLFYITGFTYSKPSSQHSWTINPRQIGAKELADSGLSAAKNLSVTAKVQVSDSSGTYYQLTESSPVGIVVNTTSSVSQIVFSSSGQAGAPLKFSVQNAPNNFGGMTVSINGKESSTKGQIFTVIISEENGFNITGTNNIRAVMTDNNGKEITGTEQSFTFKVGEKVDSSQPGTTDTSKTTVNTTAATDRLYNPIPEEDLTHAFLLVAQGFLAIIGAWAVMFIIVGGFQMVTAAGNEEAIAKAKKTITWAIIGTFVALLSFSIIAIVQNVLRANIKSTTVSTPKK